MTKHTAVLAALGLALAGAGWAAPARAEDQAVKIGTEADYAPFEYKDADGTLKGMEIDLANLYCARAHLKCTFVNMDFDGLIPALNAHQIDAALSQMSVTDERKKSVAFTAPVTHNDERVIAPKGSTVTDDPTSFKGKTVAVQSGTILENWANAHLKGIAGDIKVYQGQDQAFEDLKSGRADATIVDAPVGFDWLQKGGKDGFEFVGKPLDDKAIFGPGETAIALRTGDKALLESLNGAIVGALKEGDFAKVNAKYFPFSLAPGM